MRHLTHIITLIATIIALYGCYSPPTKEECKTIFTKNRRSFYKFQTIAKETKKKFPQCGSFLFTYTLKAYWQECSKRINDTPLPDSFILKENGAFLSDFMRQCKIHLIEVDSNEIGYTFFGSNPFTLKHTLSPKAYYENYKIADEYYLIPSD